MTRPWLALLAPGLLALATRGATVQELPLGQAVWRPSAATLEVPGPGGAPTTVTADLWGLALERPTQVVIRMHTLSGLGLVIRLWIGRRRSPWRSWPRDSPTPASWSRTLSPDRRGTGREWPVSAFGRGHAAAGAPLCRRLARCRPDRRAAAARPLRPRAGRGTGPRPGGRWAATWQGDQGWLHDLDAGATYAVPKFDGPLLRIAFADDGWSLLTVTAAGVVTASLPELAPYARFVAQSGVRDAVPAPEQRVVVLPGDAPAYIASPSEEDLAYLPGTRGAARLLAGHGEVVGCWYADRQLQLIDVVQRRELGRARWPAEPSALALHPTNAEVAGSGPAQTVLWRAGAATAEQVTSGATALAYHASGTLALASGGQVKLLAPDGTTTPLEPAVEAIRLEFNAAGHRLAAQTATGEVLVLGHDPLARPAPARRQNACSRRARPTMQACPR